MTVEKFGGITYSRYLNGENGNAPYVNSFEHVRERFSVLEAYMEASMILWQTKDKVLPDRTINELHLMWQHVDKRVRASIEGDIRLRLEHMTQMFRLTPLESFALCMALYWEYNPKVEAILVQLQRYSNHTYPTRWLAVELFRMVHAIEEWEVARFLTDSGNLSQYLLPFNSREERKEAFLSEPIRLKRRVVSYVLGLQEEDLNLKEVADIYKYCEPLGEMLLNREELKRLASLMPTLHESKATYCIHIYGQKGSGKHFLLKNLAKQFQFHIIFVRLHSLLQLDMRRMAERLYDVLLESVMSNAFICFEYPDSNALKERTGDIFTIWERVVRFTREELPYFFLLSEEKDALPNRMGLRYTSVGMPPPSTSEKIRLWKAFAKDYRMDSEIKPELFANRYSFSIQGIRDLLQTAYLTAKSENHECIFQEDLVHAVKQLQSDSLGNEAIRMNAEFDWDDLILDENSRKQIVLACNQVKYKHVVLDEWGFRKKLPYGKGVSILFYGPPGTGKTMAAQVMASDLGIDLYRIDLSQLVSKYVGETEKNISTLFQKASNANVLLFFDEADAIFAKRSEVSDSNDRNANAMTAHLLQKLEDYDGVAILATNYIRNIDDAFKRRIRHMVRFAFPSPEERLQLWTSLLPNDAKCEETLDFAFFAKQFELSGSSIKEILVNAAYMAAAEGTGIRNVHIVECVKMNYAKYGKTLTVKDFGYLG